MKLEMLTWQKKISIQPSYRNTPWYFMSHQFCFALVANCHYAPLIALFFIAPSTHHQLNTSFISQATSCMWIDHCFIIVIAKIVLFNFDFLPF